MDPQDQLKHRIRRSENKNVDIYCTAALTSFSDSINYVTYLFSEWRIEAFQDYYMLSFNEGSLYSLLFVSSGLGTSISPLLHRPSRQLGCCQTGLHVGCSFLLIRSTLRALVTKNSKVSVIFKERKQNPIK